LRQWWDRKWRGGTRPEPHAVLSEETSRRWRGTKEEDTCATVPHALLSWTFPNTLEKLAHWVMEMDLNIFLRGAVVEKFEYIYALYVTGFDDDVAKEEWHQKAVESLLSWLEHAM
jgi:hypothetical protein